MRYDDLTSVVMIKAMPATSTSSFLESLSSQRLIPRSLFEDNSNQRHGR